MKGYLLFKDGRRRELDDRYVGGIRFYQVTTNDLGRHIETIFEADAEVVDGCIVYRETESKDVSAQMRESAARLRRDTGPRVRFSFEDRGFLPGETEVEQARRIAIEKGEIE